MQMTKSLLLTLLVSVALCAGSLAQTTPPAQGQAPAEPKLGNRYDINVDHVKPAMAMDYENLVKEFIATMKQNNITSRIVTGLTLEGLPATYTTVTPLPNWADLDQAMAQQKDLATKVGQSKMQDFDRRFGQVVDYSERLAVREVTDWAYVPAGTPEAMDPAALPFRRYQYIYLVPGHDDDLNQLARDYKALWAQKNIPRAYHVYYVIFGRDLPVIVVSEAAKSETDFYTESAQIDKTIGDAVKPLEARLMKFTRRIEVHTAKVRPDMSYIPAAPPAAK
jgi:hypothetical protein